MGLPKESMDETMQEEGHNTIKESMQIINPEGQSETTRLMEVVVSENAEAFMKLANSSTRG